MTETYKLLIDSPSYPVGTIAEYNEDTDSYFLYLSQEQKDAGDGYYNTLSSEVVENRPHIWELQEDKLDLRSPEAEKMRVEARSKRWEFVPNDNDRYYMCSLDGCYVYDQIMTTHDYHYGHWNMGNCHRTKEEALAWGKKYARYFLTE